MRVPFVWLEWFGWEAKLPDVWKEHSRFPKVINLISGDMTVSVCARDVPPGPYRLVLSLPNLDDLRFISRENGVLSINGELEFDAVESMAYWPDGDFPIPEEAALQTRIGALWTAFRQRHTPGSMYDLLTNPASGSGFNSSLAEDFARGIRLLEDGHPEEAARAVKGRGPGFTPAGDDFLCGLLTGMAWLDRGGKKTLSKSMDLIIGESWSSNQLVNTFLHQARHLKLNSDWNAFLRDATKDVNSQMHWLDMILAHGSTSGSDEMFGFFTACRVYGDLKGW